MNSANKNNAGFTLLELMVAMALSGLVMIGIFSVYRAGVKNHITQNAMAEMQQDIRAGMHMMAREIRVAGYDPFRGADAGITTARSDEIVFTADLNEDGECTGPGPPSDANEQIRYALTNDNLGRQVWNGGLQPVALNIDAINFVYLDSDRNDLINNLLVPPAVPDSDLDDIRSIQISIVARSGKNVPALFNSSRDLRIYRNQQNDIILPAQGDYFKRVLLTAEIKVRNLGL